jgi:threonine-phosphate decarboxylase
MRFHGGKPPKGFLDFSTPINPLGPPNIVKELIYEAIKNDVHSLYPDYSYRTLREAIANFYNIESDYVIPLNGAAEALYMIIAVERPSIFVVFEPTFGDYKQLLYSLNIHYISIQYLEIFDRYYFPIDIAKQLSKTLNSKCIAMLSNPNNPLGTQTPRYIIEELVQMYRDCLVVIDEAFMDLSKKYESAIELTNDYRNLIVIKSLTKTFAVPGLRIGFLYTLNRNILYALESFRQPWNINSIAEYVFSRALNEYKDDLWRYIEYSRNVIEFYIDVNHIQKALEEFKIYIRNASTYTYLTKFHGRVSIRLRDDNEKLVNALKQLLERM